MRLPLVLVEGLSFSTSDIVAMSGDVGWKYEPSTTYKAAKQKAPIDPERNASSPGISDRVASCPGISDREASRPGIIHWAGEVVSKSTLVLEVAQTSYYKGLL